MGCASGETVPRGRFEQVVSQVRRRVIEPGQYRFRLDADLDPASLVLLPSTTSLRRGDARGVVRVTLTKDGKLAVSIETRDDGHAGEFGVMYLDSGISDADLEGTRLDSQREVRIDDHWVRWTYDLG